LEVPVLKFGYAGIPFIMGGLVFNFSLAVKQKYGRFAALYD
jgi:hypothetical protein